MNTLIVTEKPKPSPYFCNMSDEKYLHGFTSEEQERLYQQGRFLENIVYSSFDLSGIKNLLEAGSGVGAQTEILLRRFPDLQITCIDFSAEQIAAAKKRLDTNPDFRGRYSIQEMDATNMQFAPDTKFDGAFLCWVLEHIPQPQKVLAEVKRVLQPGSKIFLTEVQNASFFLDPYSPNVLQYWTKYNDLQIEMGGDPFVGAKLGNMLHALDYKKIKTEIKTFFLDSRDPVQRSEMLGYWKGLMLSGMPNLMKAGYVNEEMAANVKAEMEKVAADPDAVFFYSFIQAVAEI